MDGLICEQQVPRIRKEGSFKLSGRRTCSTLHWHRAWICLGEICWAQNIEALFMTQTSSIPWSGSTCFNPCHLILESFLIFTHGCEAIPNWVPPSEASFARTKHSPQKSDPQMIRRGWSTGLWLDLNGYDRRLILFVAFPKLLLYSEETNINLWKWLTTTFSKLNTDPISQLSEHLLLCSTYIRTLPPKEMMCKSMVWTLISLCLWMFVVHSGIPCSVRNNNDSQQVPVANHTK